MTENAGKTAEHSFGTSGPAEPDGTVSADGGPWRSAAIPAHGAWDTSAWRSHHGAVRHAVRTLQTALNTGHRTSPPTQAAAGAAPGPAGRADR